MKLYAALCIVPTVTCTVVLNNIKKSYSFVISFLTAGEQQTYCFFIDFNY